jgi:hypothetical protein
VKRWTLRILLCLILLTGGAITTVAVAWGLAYRMEIDSHWRPTTDPIATTLLAEPSQHKWTVLVCQPTGAMKVISLRYSVEIGTTTFPPTQTHPQSLLPSWMERRDETVGAGRIVEVYGWPSLSIGGEVAYEFDDFSGYQGVRYSWGIPQPEEWRDYSFSSFPSEPFFPLRPIWPGFAIDTLFYTAIWGGVFFGFAGAKWAIRRRRGRCPRCGYDLRGHGHEGTPGEPRRHEGLGAGCPECGWGR